MRRRETRWGLLVFVTMALVLVALLGFSSSAWATPAQEHAQQQSVPPIKTADMDVVCPGERFVFEITFRAGPDDWNDVVVTDDMDPAIRIDSVSTSQGTATYAGQLVTVNVGDVTAGTTVTILINCTIRDTAPAGLRVENAASVIVEDPSLEFDPRAFVIVCGGGEFVPEPGSLVLLGSGLAGLGGYAALRWSNRRRT